MSKSSTLEVMDNFFDKTSCRSNLSYLTPCPCLANIVPAFPCGPSETPNPAEEQGCIHGSAVRQQGLPRREPNQIAAHLGVASLLFYSLDLTGMGYRILMPSPFRPLISI